MKKQIFNNIVSEKTLKEAYGHHSMLREGYLESCWSAKDIRDLGEKMAKNGCPTRKYFTEVSVFLFGKKTHLRYLTPEQRNEFYYLLEEKYEDSEFFVAE